MVAQSVYLPLDDDEPSHDAGLNTVCVNRRWLSSFVSLFACASTFIIMSSHPDLSGSVDSASSKAGGVSLAEKPNGWCEHETGGTCTIFGCNAKRGPTNCSRGMCLCVDGWCSDTHGVCHHEDSMRLLPVTYLSPAWFRKEIHCLYFAAPLAMILRTGLLDAFLFALLLHCIGGGPKREPTSFNFKTSTWSSQLKDLGLSDGVLGQIQGILVMLLKIGVYHLSQPLAMIAAFYAYGDFMSDLYWHYGLLVCFRECWYLLAILMACCYTPHAFLFAPFEDERSSVKLCFFASPQEFLALCLRHKGWVCFEAWTFLISVYCDWVEILAFLIGTYVGDYGTIWPALGISYILVFLSFPVTVYIRGKVIFHG